VFTTFLLFTLIAAVIHFLVRNLFKKYQLVDHPDGIKKVHKFPVPFSGGLSFAISLIVLSILSYVFYLVPDLGLDIQFMDINFLNLWLLWVLITSLLLLSISLIDDFIDLPVWVRLFTQVSCCLIVMSNGDLRLTNLGPIFGGNDVELSIILSYLFTIFCVVGITNAFNWIDGLDGLFSFQVFAAGLGIFLLTQNFGTSAIIFWAAFIPYVFMNMGLLGAKFKVFIGDHGAMMIGYLIAWNLISISENDLIRPIDAVWCVCIVLLNTFRVIWKRYKNKHSVFSSDRTHIHHYFLDRGYSDNISLLIISSLTILISAIGYLLYLLGFAEWVSLAIFLLLLVGWSLISYLINEKNIFKNF